MIEYSTKLDTCGNRYYLGIDAENKTFITLPPHLYRQADVITITKKDRRKMIEQLKKDGFTEKTGRNV